MHRAQIGGQVKTVISFQAAVYFQSLFFSGRNAQGLWRLLHGTGNLFIGSFSVKPVGHPVKELIHIRYILHDFFRLHGQILRKLRLGGAAENRTDAVPSHQLFQCLQAGSQKIQRHHLSLIKNDDTVCYIVQFAAFGCPVSIKRFPELLIGSDYDGSIPVFRRQLHPPCHGLFHIVIVHIAVALQHISLSQKILKYFRCLFNDGHIGNDINNPSLVILHSLLHGKSHG